MRIKNRNKKVKKTWLRMKIKKCEHLLLGPKLAGFRKIRNQMFLVRKVMDSRQRFTALEAEIKLSAMHLEGIAPLLFLSSFLLVRQARKLHETLLCECTSRR